MKKNILFIFIGIIIATGIGVVANDFVASQIDYKNDKTVSDALDDLYTEVDKYKSLTFKLYAQSYTNTTNSNGGMHTAGLGNFYTKFKITALTNTSGTGTCTIAGWNGTTAIDLSLNTEYNISTYPSIYVRAKSTNTTQLICVATITFYN